MTYIATFYSHFGAVRFKREWPGDARLMPVPRDLSSSCGTCVRYQGEAPYTSPPSQEVEQIVEVTAGGYVPRYRAADS